MARMSICTFIPIKVNRSSLLTQNFQANEANRKRGNPGEIKGFKSWEAAREEEGEEVEEWKMRRSRKGETGRRGGL